MKKFLITEEEKNRILGLYQIIKEDEIKKCNKCSKSYSGSLDKCGFYAVERFEENYGTASGTGMGDNYFELTYKVKDTLINSRLTKNIPNAWSSMSPKTKMQIWSFMFNSDSESNNDHFRWLAVLYLTANKNISVFKESDTLGIINKTNTTEWNNAIELVNKTSTWDNNKLLLMLDGQYSTYNPEKYKATWSYRPKYLDKMYDDCMNGIDPVSTNINQEKLLPKDDTNIIIKGDRSLSVKTPDGGTTDDAEKDFKSKISGQTKDISIDLNSVNFDGNNLILQYNEGDTDIYKMSYIWDNISNENLESRLDGIKSKNTEYEIEVFGEDGGKNPRGFYWRGLIFIIK
jgi:hypothetical protein